MRRLLPLIVLLLAAACSRGARPPLEVLEEAAAAASRGGGTERQRALAGWHAWLVEGDAAKAAALAHREDPWGALLEAELGRRALQEEAEVDALLSLVERHEAHPLAAVAAHRIASRVGRSPSLDRMIDERLGAILPRLRGETAARVRAAIRSVHAFDPKGVAATVQAGVVTEAAVVGPFSDWNTLDFDAAFAPERQSVVPPSYEGIRGRELQLRPFRYANGWISLQGEPDDGDVHYALTVAQVREGGSHRVRLALAPSTGARLFIDGVEILSRRNFGERESTVVARTVELEAGDHLIALRLHRGGGSGNATLSIAPADGRAATLSFRAARPGDRNGRKPQPRDDESLDRFIDARALASSLEEEAGLAAVVAAILDGERRDLQGALQLVEAALSHAKGSPPLRALRAELVEHDPSLPSRIAAARAAADWEFVLSGDPNHPLALVAAADLLRAGGRHDDAREKLELAEAAAAGRPAVALAKAQLALARGSAEEALLHARAASEAGSCSGGNLLFDLARSADAVAVADEAAERWADCPGGRSRLASLHRMRGRVEEALAVAEELSARDPQNVGAGLELVELFAAAGRLRDAVATLESLESAWPRSAHLPGRRAELLERMGELEAAEAARDRSLSLAGAQLDLRRLRAHRAGSDVLSSYDRDAAELIADFERSGRKWDAPAVILWDFGAIEAYADGSSIERVHVLAKILDKRGMEHFGEQHVPPGAQVIHLRTIKPDGRILVPEAIGGKESISAAGLAVGDYVELAYLTAHGPRGGGLHGWSASPFYFRSAELPMVESIYVVRAEKEAGLELDVHNGMEGAEIVERDGWLELTLRRRDVPAYLPEPSAVSRQEFLPWAQVGAGADEAQLLRRLGDALSSRIDLSPSVSRWARQAVASAGESREAKVRALWERVMTEIEGDDRGFSLRASHILAQRRGNRNVLLAAALESLGIDVRWVAVRTFEQDPDPRRFPAMGRFRHYVLALRLAPDAGYTFLDASIRHAPLGALPDAARDADAWLLPRPGEKEPLRVRTPDQRGDPRGTVVELRLSLDDDGKLHGEGEERYLGIDGAKARNALESLDDDRRRQVVEAALARKFPGVVLESLKMHFEEGDVVVGYRFLVSDALRELGDGRRSFDLSFLASELGRSWLQRATRETPLLVSQTEKVSHKLQIELPSGVEVVGGLQAERALSDFGSYQRTVGIEGGRIALSEELELLPSRVPPDRYDEFSRFLGEIDRAQQARLLLSAADGV